MMKLNVSAAKQLAPPPRRPHGFALVVTLSLMILLTVIAVGLLSLSSISLRSSAQGDAMQAARSNARLALMLAIGDLQKQLGPDTRVSATADQIAASNNPAVSTTPQPQRQWAGAYNAWPAGLPAAARPEPRFLQWFVSGNPASITDKNFAGTALPANSRTSVEIVTANTVGDTGDPVRVPLISQTITGNSKNNFAWWVSDLGTKALIAPAKEIPTALAEVRADQQVAPASNLRSATAGTLKPFASLAPADPRLSNVATWQSAALIQTGPNNPPADPKNIRGLFHDLTPQNRGLLTNVRAGGFRKDLSMELERTLANAPGSGGNANTPLYKVGTGTNQENGINFQELWSYYSIYSPSNSKGLRRSGSAPFTTGGSMPSGTPHLQLSGSPELCQSDEYFYFKQPVIISYQVVLSFQFRTVSDNSTSPPKTVNRLHLVADPIVTFWNPLDVPVVLPAGLLMTVKFWQIPYNLNISKNDQTVTCPISGVSLDDSNLLSLQVGGLERMVFKPGEVIKTSQSGATLAISDVPDKFSLGGKKGFNFGSGVAMPLFTDTRANIDASETDRMRYVSATPNDLTAGEASGHGKVLPGGRKHSRHFSLTHHEYYIGKDRGSSADSLGIGGAYLDWDFGNKRLKFNDPLRQETGSGIGIKSSGRYNALSKPEILETFTENREIPTTGAKMPFMLLSFNAKTETGSTRGTRSLSRFNPKALHLDFYDLSSTERDMLPYEYSIESMNGWTTQYGSLDVDTSGRGYFGGAMNAADGTGFVATHSIPREPIVSLAAFQHSFANGFDAQRPRYGYAALNAREPLLPQISHAIGNSMAPPMLDSNQTEGSLPGGRPLADHSYLANQALWDDWFLSGIAPQNQNTFSRSRTQKVVASEFFDGTGKLPVVNYLANLRENTPAKILNTYFSGATPSAAATSYIASLIKVDGMFNVNSTSVEAWKSLLGGRKDRPLVVRDPVGRESIKSNGTDTPVAGLLSPQDIVATGSGSVEPNQPGQWVGHRTLSDDEIDRLARGIVKEVRKRGPFLSLSDFVNRRVGSDRDLARAGAIQNALDAGGTPASLDGTDTRINEGFMSGTRLVSSDASGRAAFQEAEQGAKSYGSPGVIKQADILTPIAPILSARSDSFLIRGYGEKTDASGKVIARAWCEAVVQRAAEFVDPADPPEKAYSSISASNKTFGRRFEIVSFRWLNASEV